MASAFTADAAPAGADGDDDLVIRHFCADPASSEVAPAPFARSPGRGGDAIRGGKGVRFEPTLTLGSLISLAGLLAAVLGGWISFTAAIARIDERNEVRATEMQRQLDAINGRLNRTDERGESQRGAETQYREKLVTQIEDVAGEVRFLHEQVTRLLNQLESRRSAQSKAASQDAAQN
jgi:hypothetical protein